MYTHVMKAYTVGAGAAKRYLLVLAVRPGQNMPQARLGNVHVASAYAVI